jgi:RHS repeat-associated protein
MPVEPNNEAAQTESAAPGAGLGVPSISLPKGGGAIHGIGEKFGANPVTGTGSLNVPIFATTSRADFYPKLSLAYDSGSGNGPWGLGWSFSVPSITRKTDKGLPRYSDAEESDVFILSDAEDLVPSLIQNGSRWIRETRPALLDAQTYTVDRYRPRVEGLFARIERWRNDATGEAFWKTVSRDNVISIFGRDAGSRIVDPDDASRVFKWLLDLSYDAKGSVISYEYKPEDSAGVPVSTYERHRDVGANRYVKRIKYGFQTPYYADEAAPFPSDWLLQLVFDYGEHDLQTPTIDEATLWDPRSDAFSTYRAAFEIRTHRLCRRVLMFHQFAELGDTPCLVRSTDFEYSENPVATYLTSVAQTGYIRNRQDGSYSLVDPKTGEALSPKSLPRVDFTYTAPAIDQMVHVVSGASVENIPEGVDGSTYQWLDFDSEGSPGILTEQAGGWFYKRNVSNLPRDGSGAIVLDDDAATSGPVRACFEHVGVVASRPSLADLSAGQQHFLDLAGEGQTNLVQYRKPVAGFYEQEEDGEWQSFVPFSSSPNIEWRDPNLRFVDLDGDGFPDVLISEHEMFTWYRSSTKDGFGPANRVPKPFDEESGPALIFADAAQSIYLADFSGDGLTDIVRIRNGEVCYWPNLGYGRFGAKITMDGAPVFDSIDDFEQSRIRLADTDGSGTTDVLYLGRNTISLWFNQSGNSWSSPRELPQFPATDDVDSVSVVDLLGNGTACVVWSSPLPGDVGRPMRYIDLMGGQKPHLLISVTNNLGSETSVQYAASTKFYLLDRAAGRPWITKLPFPVHVVERVETFDHVSKTKLVSTYRYHHGYYDGVEREFRGFGMVEQLDTESFSKFSGTGLFTESPETEGEELHLPPVRTRSWFHTGVCFSLDSALRHYEDEYYKGDSAAVPLPDMDLPAALSPDEAREACRALKGRPLRQEVYADDGSPQAGEPYGVTEYSYQLRRLQPRLSQRHSVFCANQTEALAYHYERNPSNPRVSHEFTLEVDEFGNPTKTAAVAYPRRSPSGGQPIVTPEQSRLLITYTENEVANESSQPDWYRIGLPVETSTFELTGATPSNPDGVFALDELLAAAMGAVEIPDETVPDGSAQKRLIARTRILYRRNNLSGPSPTGVAESLALPYETYKMAFTSGLLANAYSAKATDAALLEILGGEGGYVNLGGDGVWWIPSGRVFFSPDPAEPDPSFARKHFYLAQGFRDPFSNSFTVAHDYDLVVRQTTDPLQNVSTAQHNYRLVLPWLLTDPNANRSAVRFDALGVVVATAVMGKEGKSEGDILDLTTPESAAADDPTGRIEYNRFNWMQHGVPNFAHAFAREQHGAANPRWQESYSYSDGMGREVMKKVQAEPGLAPARDANGALEHGPNGKLVFVPASSRWVGSGRTVFDNKGNPIKKYEPFFDSTYTYDDEKDLAEWGVTPILRYDPLRRLIRTDSPNGTFSHVEFDPWQQISSDENDTVLSSRWYADRGSPDPSGAEPADPEARAAWLAAKHANTPVVAHLDTLARTFLTIADNGAAGQYQTRSELDIQRNLRAVTDAVGRKVMAYDYQMLGTRIHQVSIDAGERWLLNDVAGKPIRAWDSSGFQRRTAYDALRRPIALFVSKNGAPEFLAETFDYGESMPHPETTNHRTRIWKIHDGAGISTNEDYDFKGNLLRGTRQLLQNYKVQVDWEHNPAPDAEQFTSSTTYDALNRPVTMVTPDSSVIRPAYNEANLLERLNVNLRGAAAETPFVTNIDYNAKAQRDLIEYGNGTRTDYTYDAKTFRLTALQTSRASDHADLQKLSYTYDPVGNITAIQDAAKQTIYFDNQPVTANAAYVYDALYRLIGATGREHSGQLAQPQTTWEDTPRMNQPLPTDSHAMRNYTENYAYDAVGNFLQVVHRAANGNWTCSYAYDEPNPNPTNNRLTSTTVGSLTDTYQYDAHGSITRMPHLPTMGWDFKNQFQSADLQGGGMAYYVYDASGQRTRKVIERVGAIVEDRLYFGGYEIYRMRLNGVVALERETLYVMDDKRRVAMVDTKTVDARAPAGPLPTSLTRYQFDNHLGSACLELDKDAGVISCEEYYPYGSTSYQAVRAGVEVSSKRYRYTGKERDEESGLYYHGARYYAPWLGRWITCDPAGMVDGTNLYQYVRANPLRFNDLTGHESTTASQALAGLAKPNDKCNVMCHRQESKPPSSTPSLVWTRHRQAPDAASSSLPSSQYYWALSDPGELSETGIRVPATGELLATPGQYYIASHQRYMNPMAEDYASAGYVHFAELLEAGHVCAACHLIWLMGHVPADEEFNLRRYDKVSKVVHEMREQVVSNVFLPTMTSAASAFGPLDIGSELSPVAGNVGSRSISSVVLGENGLPTQIHRADVSIGPAYATLEEAVAASNGGHYLEVILSDRSGTQLARWFEASETGLPEMLGHTEQKALLRLNLSSGLEVEMRGFYPPCPYGAGCMNALQGLADRSGTTFTYVMMQPSGNEVIYPFIPGQ